MIKVTDWLLINVTILATCPGIKASEIAPVESTSSQAKQFIDNIFDYTLAQIDAPKGIKLANKKVTHPVFGKMYVISHKDDIDYYDRNVTDESRETLVDNFLCYVAEISSRKIEPKELKEALLKMTGTKVGMNTLKVITAKYMQVYNKYKEFYNKNNVILNACIYAEHLIEELEYKLNSPKYENLIDSNWHKLDELDQKITTDKTSLSISVFDNPLFSSRDLKYQAAYEKFKKYHKLHQKLKEFKKKQDVKNQESMLNSKNKIFEEIMPYDDLYLQKCLY